MTKPFAESTSCDLNDAEWADLERAASAGIPQSNDRAQIARLSRLYALRLITGRPHGDPGDAGAIATVAWHATEAGRALLRQSR